MYIVSTHNLIKAIMRYQLEIEITAPRERVLELFLDHNNLKKWQPELVSFERTQGDGRSVGSQSKQIHKMGNKEIEMIETITVYEYPDRFSATYETDGVWNLVETWFYDEGTKTKWVVESEFKCSGIMMKLMLFLMPGMFKKQTFMFMERFKTFVEEASDSPG